MNLEEERKAAVTAAAYVKEAALAVTKAIAWYVYAAKSAAETAAEYEAASKAAVKKEAKPYENGYEAQCLAHAYKHVAGAEVAIKISALYAEAAAKVAAEDA